SYCRGKCGARRGAGPRRTDRIELIHNDTGEIRMTPIDPGVDHRNQHVIAFVDAVRLKQVQLAHYVLCSGAVWYRVRSDRRLGLRSDIELVGLAGGDARKTPPYQAQCIGHRATAIDAPPADGPPG